MRLAPVVALLVVVLGGCGLDTAQYITDSCNDWGFCWTEFEVRWKSTDLLESSPKFWRFYDDYLDGLESECAESGDGGTPELNYLWRHGAVATGYASGLGGRGQGFRNGLAVHPSGRVAMMAGARLWLYDDGGVPMHAYSNARSATKNTGQAFSSEFVAFVDSDRVWSDGSGSPSVVNLGVHDRLWGPLVEYSWYEEHKSMGGFDTWFNPTDAVMSDGSLVWTNASDFTRAMTPSGDVKWSVPAAEGTYTIGPGDVAFRSEKGDYVGVGLDGRIVWQAEPWPEPWRVVPRQPLIDEGSYVGDVLPMLYSRRGAVVDDAFVLRRVSDVQPSAIVTYLDAGYAPFPDHVGMARDGMLYLSEDGREGSFPRVGVLQGYTPGLREKWSVPTWNLAFAPIGGQRSERVFTVDSACRVNVVDGATGAVIASHRMLGRPHKFVPKLVDGRLYVVAEIRPKSRVVPWEMKGRRRPDGGVVEFSDYQCLDRFVDICPPIGADWPMYVLYAFQVE